MKIREQKRQKELEKKRMVRLNKDVVPTYKYFLSIAYDGSDFGGYAKQKHKNTIQNHLEKALFDIFGYTISTIEASRTDAKVHALVQKIMFELPEQINLTKVKKQLNEKLDDRIVIIQIETVKNSFHSRYDVKNKTYEYTIIKQIDPRYCNYALHIDSKLNTKKMIESWQCLLGKHDFNSFCSAKATSTTTIRTINNIKMVEDDKFIRIYFNADGFLYNMIRLIVNCLIDIGLEKQEINYLEEILALKSKPDSLQSAPAQGLCLIEVNY